MSSFQALRKCRLLAQRAAQLEHTSLRQSFGKFGVGIQNLFKGNPGCCGFNLPILEVAILKISYGCQPVLHLFLFPQGNIKDGLKSEFWYKVPVRAVFLAWLKRIT